MHTRTTRLVSVVPFLLLTLGGCRSSVPLGGPPGDGDAAEPEPAAAEPEPGTTPDPVATTYPPPVGTVGEPMPSAVPFETDRFMDPEACAHCHLAEAGSDALRTADGSDISPVGRWGLSMMAYAGRDPYWLAAYDHELAALPAGAAHIKSTCTRCHAPAAHVEQGGDAALTPAQIVSDTTLGGELSRAGVSCTVCHQVEPANLGTAQSFTGGFVLGDGETLYGPHSQPFANPMQMHTGYTPTEGDHITDSAMCATCHTVITRALNEQGQPTGPAFAEQSPYLEWRNSAYSTETAAPLDTARSCQDCHVPTRDASGTAFRAAIATRPPWLDARSPLGDHAVVGGNAYMLGLLARFATWANGPSSAAALQSAQGLAEENLRRAAAVHILDLRVDDEALAFSVRVDNLTGHKFPTSYPGRRAFLRVTVRGDDGEMLWRSGRLDALGALVDGEGTRLDNEQTVVPHAQRIDREGAVQVYESVMGDAQGDETHVLLAAAQYVKDNRLLPLGHDPTHPDAAWTRPVGTADDDDFVGGSDMVRYRVEGLAQPAQVEVDLVFQTLGRENVEALLHPLTEAAGRLDAMTQTQPDLGVVVAQASEAL